MTGHQEQNTPIGGGLWWFAIPHPSLHSIGLNARLHIVRGCFLAASFLGYWHELLRSQLIQG